jgi:hypothetical protein
MRILRKWITWIWPAKLLWNDQREAATEFEGYCQDEGQWRQKKQADGGVIAVVEP